MSRYRNITTEVEIDLSEFDTDDLLEELESRGWDFTENNIPLGDGNGNSLLEKIYQKRRTGRNFDAELDQFLQLSVGRIV
jgi:hypothetical protein